MKGIVFWIARFFGKEIISVDSSKDGTHKCVAYQLNGRVYIWKTEWSK